jgi:spermidine synthase
LSFFSRPSNCGSAINAVGVGDALYTLLHGYVLMLASCFPLNKLAIAFILSMTDSSSPARLDSSTSIFPLILAVSFFSGLAALVYEISWSRQLESLFGHTANAAAVVLTAYFGGMAIGNAIGGRLASRMCAFRAYAICEFFIATGALAIPFVLNATIQSWHNDRFDIDNPVWQLAFRVLYSLTLLAPATIAMGASLPLMNEMVSHCFPPFDPRAGRYFRIAYAVNIFGAIIGVLMASSYLLAFVGVIRSSYAAAVVSMLCAFGSVVIASRAIRRRVNVNSAEGVGSDTTHARQLLKRATSSTVSSRYWKFTACVSGAVVLSLEVLYLRLFSLILHNSTYTFSFVLVGFLLGMLLGPFAINRLLRKHNPERLIHWISVIAAISIPLSIAGFVFGTRLEYCMLGRSFVTYYASGLAIVLAIVLPVATGCGMMLPLSWASNINGSGISSREIGQLTMLNTVAAAFGAILASFVLFPRLGLWHSFALIAAVALSPALLKPLVLGQKPTLQQCFGVGGTLLVGLPFIIGDPEDWVYTRRDESLLRRWYSTYGWIDVVENKKTGVKKVQQNLHYRFGATGANSEREFRQAHLPLLLHPKPRDVLFLGLGTGMTAGGAVPHRELSKIDIVELIPEVVDAVRLLGNENRNVVDEERSTTFIDDARHFVAQTRNQYDVIVSDLFVPWESETGYLYTVEQFRASRSRLREQGIFCQWLALYQLGIDDFEMIADSLRAVFPHVTIWWGRLDSVRPIVALVGSDNPISIVGQDLDARLESLTSTGQFNDSQLSSAKRLIELYAGDWPQSVGKRLNTDEHPWIEFQSPMSQRNQQLLSGIRLREYHRDVLERLETQSLDYSGQIGEPPTLD